VRPDAAMALVPCPSCAAMVVAGELFRAGRQLFCCFEASAASSLYLMLPPHPGRLAPRFVASVFGDHGLHGCFVTVTIPSWRSGIGPEPRVLPS